MGLIAIGFAALAAAMAGDRAAAHDSIVQLESVLERTDEGMYQHKQAIDLMATAIWHLRLADGAAACRKLERAASASSGCAPITCTDLSLARLAILEGDRREARQRHHAARDWALARGAAPLAAITLWEEAMAAGARRGVLKARASAEKALGELRSLGMAPWSAEAERCLASAGQFPDGLTEREAEVLAVLAAGLTNKEIAARLHISAATVQRHIANAYAKIGVTNRSQATSYVLRHDLAYMGGAARTT